MEQQNTTTEITAAERLCALREILPELDRRYTHLRTLLRQACEGEVPAHRIRLAIGDVQSAIAACELEQDEGSADQDVELDWC